MNQHPTYGESPGAEDRTQSPIKTPDETYNELIRSKNQLATISNTLRQLAFDVAGQVDSVRSELTESRENVSTYRAREVDLNTENAETTRLLDMERTRVRELENANAQLARERDAALHHIKSIERRNFQKADEAKDRTRANHLDNVKHYLRFQRTTWHNQYVRLINDLCDNTENMSPHSSATAWRDVIFDHLEPILKLNQGHVETVKAEDLYNDEGLCLIDDAGYVAARLTEQQASMAREDDDRQTFEEDERVYQGDEQGYEDDEPTYQNYGQTCWEAERD